LLQRSIFRRLAAQVWIWFNNILKQGSKMTAKIEIKELTQFALKLADASAKIILPQFRKNITIDVKAAAEWDPVTEADRSAERKIRELIEAAYPSHGIIGEEYGIKTGSSPYSWVLDPIDGTRSFVIGMPTWATLIGLYRDEKPLLGVMNQPYVGEMFYGSPEGAWHVHQGRTEAIKVRKATSLAKAAAGTTSPHLYSEHPKFGVIQMDIAMDPGLQIYDIAALIPIIRGAGGVVGSWTDNDPSQGGNVLAASSQSLLDETIALMRG
jgi:myo-inositol-1(or 4)-monophosphatase